ncbi:MAG TPA: protein kinase [Solirubrobacter sp.]|nr:protein kinase [Solirubrobacter sp.]
MPVQAECPIYLTSMGELESGSVFAGHRIEEVAGRGGMGVVYRATQIALDRTVALKVIAAGLLEDQTVRNRFVRESKVAASIDHPNVIPIYYAGEENGIAYIAMRYVPGDDIRSLVRREGPLGAERAARIAVQVGSALDAAHGAGLVHRDIKPANVLLAAEDHVYLTDFGLTKHALSVAGSTKPGHWVGTLDYVAPEQIRGERIDARADVYSFGCLLFYTLTGVVPFPRESDEARLWAHLSEPPPKPTDLVPDLPPAFNSVIERALAKIPDERYPSAGDLGRAAMAAATGRTPAERERLVAKGAAAPVEAETVTAAAKPAQRVQPHHEPEAETHVQERSRIERSKRPALLTGALVLAVGIGIVTAVALGLGRDEPVAERPDPTPTPGATATPTPAAGEMRVERQITVGRRPNVVKVVGENVFVASFTRDFVTILSAKTGKRRSASPQVGVGVSDAAVGRGSVWYPAGRANQLVRVNGRTGRVQDSIQLPAGAGPIAVSSGAIWVGIIRADQPDLLLKLNPENGQMLASAEYPYGVQAIATSPSAVWIAARRRATIERADPQTGEFVKSKEFGGVGRASDVEYRKGAVWFTVPEDDAVYKMITRTGELIPISVGRRPRQLDIGGGRVYVTNYNSSDLYAIDEDRTEVVGEPVRLPTNPYGLFVDGDRVWVTSQPGNKLSEVVTGRGG